MTENSIPISFPPIYGERIEHIYPSVTITIERITPEIAKKMLEANINNRKLHREPLEQALNNGQWKLNGATIVFDEHGIMKDGQHRLYACVKTGKAIDTLVVRGIPHEAQITMDTGVKRSLNDYLEMDGYKNVSTVGSVGTGLLYLDTYGLESSFGRQNSNLITVQTCYEFVQEQYESRIEPLISPTMRVRSRFSGNVTQSKTLGIVFDCFRKAGDDNFEDFIDQLCSNKKACIPVMQLNNKLSEFSRKTKGTDLRPTQRHIAALIIKAWNAYMRGDDIKQLKFAQGGAHPESFPKVFIGYE